MGKGQFRILMALTVVAGFLGGGVSDLLFQGAQAHAQATKAGVQQVVKAREFVLVDKAGKTRAIPATAPTGEVALNINDASEKPRVILGAEKDGTPSLLLYDNNKKERVTVTILNGEPWLSANDAAEKARVSLGIVSKVPFVGVSDAAGDAGVRLRALPDGRMGLSITDTACKTRADLYVDRDGAPNLNMADATEGLRSSLHLAPTGEPALALFDSLGKARTVLGASDKLTGLMLIDSSGKTRTGLAISADGTPLLDMTDCAGKARFDHGCGER